VDRARCLMVARECTAFGLRKASRALARIYDPILADAGLRSTQLNLLVALALVGEAAVSRVSDELGLDRTTLTRNLGPLERDGLVERAPGSDRRVRLIRLSDRGRQTLAEALPLWEQAHRQVVAGLGKARWRELMDSLEVAAHLAEAP
jgi:DNA-binding MarR family transcriptional regulator